MGTTREKKRQRYTFAVEESADVGFMEEFAKRFSAFDVKPDARVIQYTAKGANKTDITRRLERIGVEPETVFNETRSGTTSLGEGVMTLPSETEFLKRELHRVVRQRDELGHALVACQAELGRCRGDEAWRTAAEEEAVRVLCVVTDEEHGSGCWIDHRGAFVWGSAPPGYAVG